LFQLLTLIKLLKYILHILQVLKKKSCRIYWYVLVIHTSNPSTRKADAGGWRTMRSRSAWAIIVRPCVRKQNKFPVFL
jgi:hypothetical protein